MSSETPPSVPRAKGKKSRWLWLGIAAALLIGLGLVVNWVAYRFTHSISKDAFIESHLINVAPEVAGNIVEIYVQEQKPVKKGELLALIDQSPYRQQVDLKGAQLETARAALQKAEADLALITEDVPKRITIAELKLAVAREDEAKAVDALAMIRQDVDKAIAAASHTVEAARAVFVLADEDLARYSALYEDQSVSQRRFQEATKTYKAAKAEVDVAVAKLGQAEANRKQVDIAEQQLKSARHNVGEARAVLELARLGNLQIDVSRRQVAERTRQVSEAQKALDLAQVNLDFTRIEAPYDGVIAKKWRHLGDFAQAGEPIFSMYNPELQYVTVHLEETLLEGVVPGNHVKVHVDAYSKPFRGRVLWIGSATDANFSLIPRDVSSGEFTYVVQRVPTRIWIERDERWPLLKPGLSVTVAIEHGDGDPAWVEQAWRQEGIIAGVKGMQK